MAEPATIGGRSARNRRAHARRGPETRDAIHAAATDLFAKLGYHATSMRAIASAARIQPAAIYHWYPSKEAILVSLQNDFMERLEAELAHAMDRHAKPVTRLAAAVREHVVFHGLHTREAFVTDSEIRALRPAARKALIAKRDAYQDIFIAEIEAGIEAGTLETDDPRVAAYTILLGCTGVALWFDPEGDLPLDRVADLHVGLVLSSLRAKPKLIASAIKEVT